MKIRFCRLIPFFAVAVLVLLLVLLSENVLMAKKVIAYFLMPLGLIWMALFMGIFWPGIAMKFRFIFATIWLALALAGNPYIGNALLGILERPFYASEEVIEPLDALVVLGGGTSESPGGKPAMGAHGDRILRPAALYHDGLIKALITTGRSITAVGEDRLLSRETSEIWQAVGIPEDAIFELNRPRNTAEELAEVVILLNDHPDWKRVGICSSASHLQRALKESQKQGLTLTPVPSDFRSKPLPFVSAYLIPQGRGFRDVQTACWEFLGLLM